MFDYDNLDLNETFSGLGVSSIQPVLAGGATIEKIFELPELNQFKRKNSLSEEYTNNLLLNISKPSLNDVLEDVSNRFIENHLKDFRDNKCLITNKSRDTDYPHNN